MEVSKDAIRAEINKHANENTSYEILIDGLASGGKPNVVNYYIDNLYREINQFHVLTQEDINEQNTRYSEDYLIGADVGSLVWAGDSEVYLSLSNIEDCIREAEERLDDDFNDIDSIARYVQFSLIAAQL